MVGKYDRVGGGINWYDNIEMDIKKCWRFRQDSYIPGHGLVARCCEHGDEPSGSITGT